MKALGIFASLVLLICILSAEVNGNDRLTLGVFVLCDKSMTNLLQGRNLDEYFGTFFNAINLVFQQLSSPKVKFEVVSVETAPQIRRLLGNRYPYDHWPKHINITSNGQLADDPTRKQLTEYFKKAGQPYNNSHVIVLFSGNTVLFRRIGHDNKNRKYIPVHANPVRKGICTVHKIVVTQDDGYFSGIAFTARRLARILGANYDYRERAGCLYTSGMLTGDIEQKQNYQMSSCALKDVRAALSEAPKKQCLKTKFRSHTIATNKLPADLHNPDKYCAHRYKGEPNIAQCSQANWAISLYPSPGTCEVLCCYGDTPKWRRNMFTMRGITALDGYGCNGRKNGICVNGACQERPTFQ
ncbi:uncharacterized protein LOC135401566 [Ornithodoros turicata]|uniref:uncharacterized protein LOC135401566 n=1 Tax=Ornithodoros turicata TaxID=34597 RepID=UPI00313A2C9B